MSGVEQAVITRPSVARDHCLAPTRPVDAPVYGGRYTRMFPDLPRLRADESLLHAIGSYGGACDSVAAGTAEDEGAVAAGWPFFGQFVAHDITADRSPIADTVDAGLLRNFRTPKANLECVYGGGPAGSPYLYCRDDPAKLLLAPGARDVPRNHEGLALIGDMRNDVHLFVNQLHVLFIHVHNLFVDRLREDGVAEPDVFDEARRAAMWHFQWVLLNDFLPGLAGDALAREVLASGPGVFKPGDEVAIPLEFADAAYRYGHSQIRSRYRINTGSAERPLFPDLIGFKPLGDESVVQWDLLFDLPGRPPAQRAKKLDGTLPASLITLPREITGDVSDEAYHSLAARDLQRGQATGLPSGEAVARALGVEPLTADEVGLSAHGWQGETPLWFYVLRESLARAGGDSLGPVGGRIVADVLVAIVDGDPESYRANNSGWRPTLADGSSSFTIGDLIARTPLASI